MPLEIGEDRFIYTLEDTKLGIEDVNTLTTILKTSTTLTSLKLAGINFLIDKGK